ncbi:hypothetical protein pCPXV0143 [Cowpox virus]|uniref:Uncharacterized 7.4 kDa protein n=4 Tax=Orthopoxvirus TaxID=10242 RepID=Y7K4_VACCW|nr:RecName: Full=Uncharacterized 7.4 kDa protein [Vaccinia virus WR]AAW23527.1 hypothetical protein m8136L [Vaccinia virus]ABZ80048.1 hypothetical protein GL146 [synthetic Vaccinia virus]UEC93197.1 hypothetical protein pCPXV0143 [Camelpox virus]CAB5514090.1 hypothetical protein pCPXV0143 [Cowpox virus]AAW23809.1 hypothetical protein mO136L [Vaccinia virus]
MIYLITNPPYVELEKYIKCFPLSVCIRLIKYLNLELMFNVTNSSPYNTPLFIFRFGYNSLSCS